jgi:hypothetical protein
VNLWMKRAIGAAALGGGLLALSAGAAGAQETSVEVRVCADGVLSGLLGSCGQAGSGGTSVTVDAGRDRDGAGVRARARVPRLADADVSVGTRRSRPAGASGQAPATPRAQADAAAAAGTSPGADADATARLSRLRDGRLLDLDGELRLAGVGLLGSSPFTLAGAPATDSLLPTGELTLGDLTGEAPAGIGVLETGPIASGNQAGVDVGDVSPSVPVTVCGNGVGVLGDASASCGAAQPSAGGGSTGSTGTGSTGTGSTGADVGTGDATSDAPLADLASGNQVDAGIGDVSPSVPVTVCGNSVGALGDASAACAAGTGTSIDTSAGGGASGGTGGGDPGADVGIGLDIGIGSDTSTGGIIAPPPGTTPGQTGTDGTPGSDTGTSGIPGTPGTTGTSGLLPGDGGDAVTTFAPLRPSVSGSGALPFTGAATGLLTVVAAGMLGAGVLFVRATRPAAARGGGEDA